MTHGDGLQAEGYGVWSMMMVHAGGKDGDA